jgi:hypothetical protein
MKINEITDPAPAAPAEVEAAPTQQEIQAVKQMVASLPKEPPQSALTKFTNFMNEYPVVDILTDFIPQTRMVKALINTAASLEQGDNKAALSSISTALTGSLGKAVDVGLRAHDVATAVNAYNKPATPAATAFIPDPIDADKIEPVEDIIRLAGIQRR